MIKKKHVQKNHHNLLNGSFAGGQDPLGLLYILARRLHGNFVLGLDRLLCWLLENADCLLFPCRLSASSRRLINVLRIQINQIENSTIGVRLFLKFLATELTFEPFSY